MYIGNPLIQSAFLVDTFSGNNSTTVFTMSVAPANTASVLVAVSGVLQDPSTYSVVGTTLTFTQAPPTGTGNISARYLGIPASGVTTTAYRTVTTFTATASQTTFTPPSYTVGFINVYRNGVLLTPTSDYTASNGTTVVLASGAASGDTVIVESFLVSSVLNAIPATAGSVGQSYLAPGVAGNGPAFNVWMSNGSSNYSVTSNVDTVVPLDTKIYDTATAFNNTGSTVTLNGISVPAYSFAPNVAGYYQINITFRAVGTISAGPYCYINKNGSNFSRPIQFATIATNSNISGTGFVYLNGTSDYVTFAANISGTGLAFGFNGSSSSCAMSGFLARSA